MSTLFSHVKRRICSITLAFTTLIGIFPSSSLFAQQTMSLGSLKLICPNSSAATESRTIRMRMAGANLSSLHYHMVGGIAFTQLAIPDFAVSSLNIYYSDVNNAAYIIINGEKIEIPLEMYELQPIVNFADSNDDVVMTMYGSQYGLINHCEKQDILFHPAFIDNIMGLRLFQVDALTNLAGENGYFPKFADGKPCLTSSEQAKYAEYERVYATSGTSYLAQAAIAYQQIHEILLDEKVSSYIYTDLNQPIHFAVANHKITFDGLPYYEFSTNEANKMDPQIYYYWMKSFVEDYETLLAPYCTKEEIDAFEQLMKVPAEYFAKLDNTPGLTDEQKGDYLICLFNESMNEIFGKDSEISQLFQAQMANIIPVYVPAQNATNLLKSKLVLVRKLNPLVYQEVDDVCQWTALFRYVKTQEPTAWNRFVNQINAVKPEVPSVKTPVSLG